MLPIPPDEQAQIDECIEKLAGHMMKYTEPALLHKDKMRQSPYVAH